MYSEGLWKDCSALILPTHLTKPPQPAFYPSHDPRKPNSSKSNHSPPSSSLPPDCSKAAASTESSFFQMISNTSYNAISTSSPSKTSIPTTVDNSDIWFENCSRFGVDRKVLLLGCKRHVRDCLSKDRWEEREERMSDNLGWFSSVLLEEAGSFKFIELSSRSKERMDLKSTERSVDTESSSPDRGTCGMEDKTEQSPHQYE